MSEMNATFPTSKSSVTTPNGYIIDKGFMKSVGCNVVFTIWIDKVQHDVLLTAVIGILDTKVRHLTAGGTTPTKMNVFSLSLASTSPFEF